MASKKEKPKKRPSATSRRISKPTRAGKITRAAPTETKRSVANAVAKSARRGAPARRLDSSH
jgi:hypothetical protein